MKTYVLKPRKLAVEMAYGDATGHNVVLTNPQNGDIAFEHSYPSRKGKVVIQAKIFVSKEGQKYYGPRRTYSVACVRVTEGDGYTTDYTLHYNNLTFQADHVTLNDMVVNEDVYRGIAIPDPILVLLFALVKESPFTIKKNVNIKKYRSHAGMPSELRGMCMKKPVPYTLNWKNNVYGQEEAVLEETFDPNGRVGTTLRKRGDVLTVRHWAVEKMLLWDAPQPGNNVFRNVGNLTEAVLSYNRRTKRLYQSYKVGDRRKMVDVTYKAGTFQSNLLSLFEQWDEGAEDVFYYHRNGRGVHTEFAQTLIKAHSYPLVRAQNAKPSHKGRRLDADGFEDPFALEEDDDVLHLDDDDYYVSEGLDLTQMVKAPDSLTGLYIPRSMVRKFRLPTVTDLGFECVPLESVYRAFQCENSPYLCRTYETALSAHDYRQIADLRGMQRVLGIPATEKVVRDYPATKWRRYIHYIKMIPVYGPMLSEALTRFIPDEGPYAGGERETSPELYLWETYSEEGNQLGLKIDLPWMDYLEMRNWGEFWGYQTPAVTEVYWYSNTGTPKLQSSLSSITQMIQFSDRMALTPSEWLGLEEFSAPPAEFESALLTTRLYCRARPNRPLLVDLLKPYLPWVEEAYDRYGKRILWGLRFALQDEFTDKLREVNSYLLSVARHNGRPDDLVWAIGKVTEKYTPEYCHRLLNPGTFEDIDLNAIP